jgi:AcrR family transcriptional regulator
MMEPSTKNMTKAEKTRQLIISEAAVLFNQKGYEGTSMKDIMDATGMSKGALYGHFKDKEEIAVAAFQQAVDTVLVQVGKRTRSQGRVLDKFREVIFFYKERILNPPVEGGCPIQNSSVDADESRPVLRKEVIRAMDAWQERIVRTLQKGMASGEVRIDIDAREFAVNFIGTLEGGIMMAQLYRDVRYFDTIARQLMAMVEGLKRK